MEKNKKKKRRSSENTGKEIKNMQCKHYVKKAGSTLGVRTCQPGDCW